jgi:cysteine sulfinate desulfinase/cysteine desulfurase-like protein
MGYDDVAAREVIRISFGPQTTETDIDAVLAEYRALIGKRRAA